MPEPAETTDTRPATPDEIDRYEAGDYTTWKCPRCETEAILLGKDALMAGCGTCRRERNVLVWMERVEEAPDAR